MTAFARGGPGVGRTVGRGVDGAVEGGSAVCVGTETEARGDAGRDTSSADAVHPVVASARTAAHAAALSPALLSPVRRRAVSSGMNPG